MRDLPLARRHDGLAQYRTGADHSDRLRPCKTTDGEAFVVVILGSTNQPLPGFTAVFAPISGSRAAELSPSRGSPSVRSAPPPA